jgi:oxalate decarboxylase/phosphoglucose isomerase-like protein (cupin superfamily)
MDSKLSSIHPSLRAKSAYENFVGAEGVPAAGGFGVPSIHYVAMAPWRRLGCDGAYLQFNGSDGVLGAYAGRIPPGGATLPERHLYEKMIYVFHGEGVAEFQQRDQVPRNILWRPGSLFSPPLNTLHRMMNQSSEPAMFLAVTTAPLALDHYRNEKFVFHNEFLFSERFDGGVDYFAARDEPVRGNNRREWVHQDNFIPDVAAMAHDYAGGRKRRIKIARFEMAKNSLIAQLVEWPVGRYRKAHCRSGTVMLVILRSSGYSLMWPSHLGTQPYKNGLADQVVRLEWQPGSVFSPPPNWFHQHFNTGAEPAQTLAFFCGSEQFPLSRRTDGANALANLRGSLRELHGDDPSIRRMYEAELGKKGIAPARKFASANQTTIAD